MRVRIKRIDPELPLPQYKTEGAVAMDCAARFTTTIAPHTTAYVPLNVVIKPPHGHFILMAPRSSLHKRGLLLANSVGIFDEDFAGDRDEYHAALYNLTDRPVVVERGERITQIIACAFDRIEWEEVASHQEPDRGGFGSTGK